MTLSREVSSVWATFLFFTAVSVAAPLVVSTVEWRRVGERAKDRETGAKDRETWAKAEEEPMVARRVSAVAATLYFRPIILAMM